MAKAKETAEEKAKRLHEEAQAERQRKDKQEATDYAWRLTIQGF